MSTVVTDFISKLFPSRNDNARFVMIGLDATGRTSWLYMKVLGEVVTTIPTIGFNVETIKHNGYEMTVWDVGGCDKIRPLWRHYFTNTDGIMFFVDANDRDRMDEVAEQLRWLMTSEELRDAFVLVVANKQDLPNAMSASQVSERLRLVEVLAGHDWTCMPGCLHAKELMKAHCDWLVNVTREARSRRAAATQHTQQGAASGSGSGAGKAGPAGEGAAGKAGGTKGRGSGGAGASSDPGREPDMMERWLAAEDEPDDEFLQKLEDYSLQAWDHRTHLRLAWLYLRRHGRREGLDRIHSAIRAFIEHSPVTRRRTGTTYHETMTYFWAHMVHFAMASMRLPPGAPDDFRTFLVLNPQLTNGGLFLHYYTKKLMLQTPEARTKVFLPDKRPLPSIITDIASLSLKQGEGSHAPTTPPQPALGPSDADFLQRFLDRTLDKWNHECLLRAVYCCLKAHGRQRGGALVLDALKAMQKDAFHLTINYFWLALLTHTLASEYSGVLFPDRSLGNKPVEGAGQEERGVDGTAPAGGAGAASERAGPQMPEWRALLQGRGYTSVRLKELVADEQHYLRYYNKKTVFGEAAAAQFVPPDKRSLPSTV